MTDLTPPVLEEPIPDDPTWLARRVIELVSECNAKANQADIWHQQATRNAESYLRLERASSELVSDRGKLRDENARLKKDVEDLKRHNSNQLFRITRLRNENVSLSLDNARLEQFDVRSKLDELDARAQKLVNEAQYGSYGDAVIPSDVFFSRYRKAVESQIIARVVRELRGVLPQQQEQAKPEPGWEFYRGRSGLEYRVREGSDLAQFFSHHDRWEDSISGADHVRRYFTKLDSDPTVKVEPKVWQSTSETEPAVGTRARNDLGDILERRGNGWHWVQGCCTVCGIVMRWDQIHHFPLTEVVA